MSKIILTTIGSLGDLHPFIAIALALERRGFEPVMAIAEDQVDKVRAAGLQAVAALPSFETKCYDEEAVRRLVKSQRRVLDDVVLPALSASAESLDTLARDAVAIVSSPFVLAAQIIAEKHGVPLVSVVLQPMGLLSAHDPPHTPDFWMMKHAPESAIGLSWNRAAYAAGREYFHRAYHRRIDRVRARYALAPRSARRMFESGRDAALTLCCYSPQFAPLPPDAPAHARVTGFPMFDSRSGACERLDTRLAAFLADGPPPIVFTLGTFVVGDAGHFYDEAAEAARVLGRRAILLTGGDAATRVDGDVLRCGYAPHSLVFPSADAIVHHGGVGTTGQALRSGKPQLVVPHMGDQNDNAHRIKRMGVGQSLRARRFSARRAVPLLAALLEESRYRDAAARTAALVAAEQGAEAAADAIEAHLVSGRALLWPRRVAA